MIFLFRRKKKQELEYDENLLENGIKWAIKRYLTAAMESANDGDWNKARVFLRTAYNLTKRLGK
jgi:phage terminase large subunit GpA-like protein